MTGICGIEPRIPDELDVGLEGDMFATMMIFSPQRIAESREGVSKGESWEDPRREVVEVARSLDTICTESAEGPCEGVPSKRDMHDPKSKHLRLLQRVAAKVTLRIAKDK